MSHICFVDVCSIGSLLKTILLSATNVFNGKSDHLILSNLAPTPLREPFWHPRVPNGTQLAPLFLTVYSSTFIHLCYNVYYRSCIRIFIKESWQPDWLFFSLTGWWQAISHYGFLHVK